MFRSISISRGRPLAFLLASSPKLAMKIAKKATLEEIEPRHWDAFALEINIGAPYLRRRIRQLYQATVAQGDAPGSALNQNLPGGENFDLFADLVADRAKRLALKAR